MKSTIIYRSNYMSSKTKATERRRYEFLTRKAPSSALIFSTKYQFLNVLPNTIIHTRTHRHPDACRYPHSEFDQAGVRPNAIRFAHREEPLYTRAHIATHTHTLVWRTRDRQKGEGSMHVDARGRERQAFRRRAPRPCACAKDAAEPTDVYRYSYTYRWLGGLTVQLEKGYVCVFMKIGGVKCRKPSRWCLLWIFGWRERAARVSRRWFMRIDS